MTIESLNERYSLVPLELKSLRRWVCYNVETIEDGKTTKRPYNPLNGKLAKVNDQLTWNTFNIAINGCVKYGFDGLGFILGNGIFGIDLDNHPDENGEVKSNEEFNELANEFINALDSYSEYSQSGKGIHIICQGKLPEGARRKGSVEMYDTGRFFAFTGNPIHNVPINNREQEIIPLWEKYVKTENNFSSNLSTQSRYIPFGAVKLEMSDEDIINAALHSKNGSDFYRYYHDGDLSYNNNDASKADLSFCNMLAFWCDKDEAQMDRIFRNSALFRKKWDEYRGNKTYGQMTIEAAVRNVANGYVKLAPIQPTFKIKNPTKEGNKEDIKQYNEKEMKVSEYNPEMNVDENGEPIFRIKQIYKKYSYSDTGNANRFYDYFGELFKFNVTDKCFMFWTGKTWIRDVTDIIRKYANKLIEILKQEESQIEEDIANYTKSGDKIKADLMKGILDAARKNSSRVANKAGKDAMLSEFKSLYDVSVESKSFNQDDFLLNTESGIVDLRTGEISSFDKSKMISKNTNIKVSYETPKNWIKFLHEVFDNGNKEETQQIVDSLQTCLGYSLSGSTKEQVMFLLYGNGSNGKSTLTEEMTFVMGDYGDNIQSSILMQQKNNNSSAVYSIAKLQTTRFVETGETDDGGRLAEAQLKALTGGDMISAQYKYGNEFSFKPKFKIWMSTNNKPIIKGTDYGIWRRLFLFPFLNLFEGPNKDKTLPDKLKAESPQILGWCIQGFLKYQENGDLIRPKAITTAIEEYKNQMDVVAQFIEKECMLNESYIIDSKALFQAYKEWAQDNSEYIMKESKFSEELKKKGLGIKKQSNGKTIYLGIRLNGYSITG